MRGLGAAAACGAVFLGIAPLAGQEAQEAEKPPYRIERAAGPITVDGMLDEPAWQRAASIELAYETRPAENLPPPVQTQLLITYDDDLLYVAFRAHDPDPSAIRAHLTDRDTAFSDDFVGIALDTFNDERRAFEFFVNPLGVQMDMFMDDVSGNEDDSWDAIWASAGRITEEGYNVEISIPWSSLRFPRAEGEQTWGFDAIRYYPRTQRHRLSVHPIDRNITCYLCQESKMTGFAGITPGRNIEVTPTYTAGRNDQREDSPGEPLVQGDFDSDFGVTGKWGITPNLTFNAALNPDFSQVEADAAQLDINTQFALFFPEKRPFFLEGADFFDTPIDAVFTRNVADPAWGVKLTGKEGANAIGLFVARDDRTNLILPGSQGSDAASLDRFQSSDAVVRYRRDLGASSTVGVLLTGREGDDYSNRVGGLDGLYRVNDSNSVRFQVLESRTEYPSILLDDPDYADLDLPRGTIDGRAVRVNYDYNSRDWTGYAEYQDIGRGFRADMGFLPKVDYTFLLAGLRRKWYGDPGEKITQILLGGDWDRTEDQSGQLLEQEAEVLFEINGPRQSFFSLDVGRRRRFFNGRTFDETFSNTYFEVEPTGNLFLGLFMRFSDEIDFANTRPGRVLQLEPSIRWDMGRHLRARVSHVFQRLEVDAGRLYTANLTQSSLIYQFNVRTFVRAILQYTDIQRTVGLYDDPEDVEASTEGLFSQLLFSYKLNPQTVLFVGYSDDLAGNERIDLRRESRALFLKVGYAWLP
jgi:hypothetical protein